MITVTMTFTVTLSVLVTEWYGCDFETDTEVHCTNNDNVSCMTVTSTLTLHNCDNCACYFDTEIV